MMIALASASASMANGIAHAASSTALMTSQCVSAFMVLVALLAGGLIGIGTLSVWNSLQSKQQNHIHTYSLPDRNIWALPAPDNEEDDELVSAFAEFFESNMQ